MKPQQALTHLYTAARAVNATADTHDSLKQAHDALSKHIQTRETPQVK